MSAVFRENVTDEQQTQLENADFENSVATFQNEQTRVFVKALGGAERTAHAPVQGGRARNAGVVMPIGDKPNVFFNEQVGRA